MCGIVVPLGVLEPASGVVTGWDSGTGGFGVSLDVAADALTAGDRSAIAASRVSAGLLGGIPSVTL